MKSAQYRKWCWQRQKIWSTLRSGLARYVSGWRKLHRRKKDGKYRFQSYEYRNRRIPLVVEFQDKEGELPLSGYFSLFAYRSAHVGCH